MSEHVARAKQRLAILDESERQQSRSASAIRDIISSLEREISEHAVPGDFLIDPNTSNATRVADDDDEDTDMETASDEENAHEILIKHSREHMVVLNEAVFPISQYLGKQFTQHIVSTPGSLASIFQPTNDSSARTSQPRTYRTLAGTPH